MYSQPRVSPVEGTSSSPIGQQYAAKKGPRRHTNMLVLRPPGFKRRVELPFPERNLPVCVRCKKNYKTRELCRTRDGHTSMPWSTTYICVTLDPSCVGEDGRLIDGPFVSKSLDQRSFCAQGSVASNTPICASCKAKNYTRSYCREKQEHRQLPWSTVYVELSATNPDEGHERRNDIQSPGATEQQPDSLPPNGLDSPGSKRKSEEVYGEDMKKQKLEETPPSPKAVEAIDGGDSDAIFPVAESMTFLLKVADKTCVMHWVDVDRSERRSKRLPSRPEEKRQDPSPAPPNPNYGHYNSTYYYPFPPPSYDPHYDYPSQSQWYPTRESNVGLHPHHYEHEHPAKQDYYPPDNRYPDHSLPDSPPVDPSTYNQEYLDYHPPHPHPPQPSYQHPQDGWHSQQPWYGQHPQPGWESYPPPTAEDSGCAPHDSGEYSHHQEETLPPDYSPEEVGHST